MIAVASLRVAGLTGFGGTAATLFAEGGRLAPSDNPVAAAMNSLRCIDRVLGSAIHLNHGEPSLGGRNGVACFCKSLLAQPQCVQPRLNGAPIHYFGRSKSICDAVFHRYLPATQVSNPLRILGR